MLSKRSIAINSLKTSIKLEDVFWDEIERQAKLHGMSWQDYVRYLIHGVNDADNRSALIRKRVLLSLRGELSRKTGNSHEAMWLVSMNKRTREICTRNSMIYAGRDTVNDLIIDDESVSRRHLMLCWDGEKWWVVDLNSKNGIFLAGEKIQTAIVNKGMCFIAGEARVTLLL